MHSVANNPEVMENDLFLSKISPLKRRTINHRLVMSAFPYCEGNAREEFCILFRIEPDGSAIVQSNIEPNWQMCLPKNNFQIREYTPNLSRDRYRIRLAFNSVARIDGKEVFVTPEQWLERRSLGGKLKVFALSTDVVTERSKNHRICINRAIMDGEITVADKERFSDILHNGIGRGRAYGCGLLSAIPIAES